MFKVVMKNCRDLILNKNVVMIVVPFNSPFVLDTVRDWKYINRKAKPFVKNFF